MLEPLQPVPPELHTLDTQFRNAYFNFNEAFAKATFARSLVKTASTHADSKDIYLAKAIARYFRSRSMDRFVDMGSINCIKSELDTYFEHMRRHALYKDLNDDLDYANDMAALCLARVHIMDDDEYYSSTIVWNFVKAWLGKDVPAGPPESTETMVDYLYGPHVWSLYYPYVTQGEDFAQYLWSLRLPLDIAHGVAVPVSAVLPDDLSEG